MLTVDFQQVGADIFQRGIASSHGGNLSVRLGDHLLITRRWAQLGHLTDNDVVETGVAHNDRSTPVASSELAVHRAIYEGTSAQAIVHAHPAYATSLSLLQDVIEPIDAQGRQLGRVPVIGSAVIDDVKDELDTVVRYLQQHPVVVVRGHGTFAIGQLLHEAWGWTSVLEESCRILATTELLRAARAAGYGVSGV